MASQTPTFPRLQARRARLSSRDDQGHTAPSNPEFPEDLPSDRHRLEQGREIRSSISATLQACRLKFLISPGSQTGAGESLAAAFVTNLQLPLHESRCQHRA